MVNRFQRPKNGQHSNSHSSWCLLHVCWIHITSRAWCCYWVFFSFATTSRVGPGKELSFMSLTNPAIKSVKLAPQVAMESWERTWRRHYLCDVLSWCQPSNKGPSNSMMKCTVHHLVVCITHYDMYIYIYKLTYSTYKYDVYKVRNAMSCTVLHCTHCFQVRSNFYPSDLSVPTCPPPSFSISGVMLISVGSRCFS